MTPTYVLHVYRSRGEYRWRITHRNGRKLCNGGESYRRISALFRTVRRLFSYDGYAAVSRHLEGIEEAWRLSRAKGKQR